MTLTVGFLLFPDVMQLDMTGPHEVFSHAPDCRVLTVWRETAPVRASSGLRLIPDVTFAECPALDVICVPGGAGTTPLLEDAEALAFLRARRPGHRSWPRSAPGRWCWARPACCGGGGRPVTGCRATCWPPSAPCPIRPAWSRTGR